jgi:hypothetical protein
MNFLKQISLLAVGAGLGLVLVGCQPSDPDSPRVAQVTAITLTPGTANLEIGGVQAFTVTGTYTDGSTFVVNFGSTFTSSAPAIARVAADTGYVTALAAGTATITATHTVSGKTGTATVTVAPLRIVSIAVSPAASTLAVGGTLALTVTGTYNNATTGPVTAGSNFVSSDPSVATVDAAGVVTAVAEGPATITATHTASGQTGTATVTVTAAAAGFRPITFDEPGVVYTLTGFGGAEDSQLAPDPAGGSNVAARVVKSATAELWAGTTVSTQPNFSVDRIPFTATDTRMTVRVRSPKAGIPVRLKVEDASDPTRSVETEALTTKVDTWETLTFDFAKPVTGTPPINLAYVYNKATIFFHFGTTGADGGGGTYYLDDIVFVAGGSSGSTGTCVAPSCTDFSGGGIGFSVFENPGGGTVEIAKDPNDAANDVVKFVKKTGDNDFFGTTITGLAGPATLTATEKTVTLRVYSPTAGTNFLLKLENGPGGAVVEKDVATTLAGTWETLSFDLSAGAAGTYGTVVIFPNGRSRVTTDKTMYADELRFPGSGGGGSGSGSTGTCTGAACVDFSEPGIGFGPFENGGGGTVAIVDDPNDATNKVVQFVKKPGDGDFFGTTITGLGGSVVLTAAARTVTMRVYSPAAGTNFLLKFEDGTGGPATTEKDAATTVAGSWETLSFVMPDAGTFAKVVLFPSGRTSVAADKTMFVDELRFPAFSTGSGGGGGGGGFVGGVFAAEYTGDLGIAGSAKTTLGGDIGFFYDPRLVSTKAYDFGGISGPAQNPGGVNNFYYGFGLKPPAIADAYFGAYVNAPDNAAVDVTTFTNLNLTFWGPAEQFEKTFTPAVQVVMAGPPVAGCGSNSGRSEVQTIIASAQKIGAASNYVLPLGGFTLKFACSGETTVAQVLASIAQVNISLIGTNIQYSVPDTSTPPAYSNGLNVGPIKFD